MRLLRPIRSSHIHGVLWCAFICFATGVLSGCQRDEIRAYRVPKEIESTPAVTPKPTRQVAVEWVVPDSWRELDTVVDMRIATFQAEDGLEVTVASFQGSVGGLLANINRWRGQIGLPETDEQGMAESIERLEHVDVIVVDLQSDASHIFGTVINVGDGKTWFVKAVGPAESIDAVKADLVAFSKTFRIRQEGGEHEHAREPTDSSQATWTPPQEWNNDSNASTVLIAAFLADEGVRITLTSLKGQGGGELGNINRWRNQLGLDPVASMEELDLHDLGGGALRVDLVSADGANRIVAAIVPEGPQTLFFKMTGSPEAIETELGRFNTFVHEVGRTEKGTP